MWKNTLLIILNIGNCTAVQNSLLKYCIKCLRLKMRFASEHEQIPFKIGRWNRALQIKLLGEISSLMCLVNDRTVCLFQSYFGVNETVI